MVGHFPQRGAPTLQDMLHVVVRIAEHGRRVRAALIPGSGNSNISQIQIK